MNAVSTEVNMADVARAAGVSVATVSRALRHVAGVSEKTRQHVREIAQSMDYVVSPEASGLSRQSTGRVAIVLPLIDTWFYATLLAAIEHELRAADLDVLLYQVDGEGKRRQFLQDLPARRKVDAVVVAALPLPPEDAARLELLGVQVVIAGGRLRDYPAVHADDFAIATTAVGHLADLGHRRIAMIRTDDTDGTEWTSDIERVRGYHAALRQYGLDQPEAYLVSVPFGPDAGARGMAQLLALSPPPTAVFAYSDEIALGALSALLHAQIAVPGEVSIIGVDGHPVAELFGLDTVSQHVHDQGRAAGRLVVDLLTRAQQPAAGIEIGMELVLRGSTGPPPVDH